MAEVKLDFQTLRDLSKVARERFGLSGAVQHGASTLPAELFHHFPETETAEIHLATEFQNIVFDNPAFPAALRDRMHAWLKENCKDEMKEGQTETQFLYKTRKKAWGPFKEEIWTLPQKETLLRDVEAKVDFLWKQLNAGATRPVVEKHVHPPDFKPQMISGFSIG
jgi:hypothetical protein